MVFWLHCRLKGKMLDYFAFYFGPGLNYIKRQDDGMFARVIFMSLNPTLAGIKFFTIFDHTNNIKITHHV